MDGAALWTSLALTAAVSAACGFALGRSRRRGVAPASGLPQAVGSVLKELVAGAVTLDLLPAAQEDSSATAVGEPLARCIPRSLGPEGLVCELLDSASPDEVRPGRAVTCVFAPQALSGRKINAFESVIAAMDPALEPPRLILAPPVELLAVPRRRHARKRVNDQRFVRVRLWLAEAEASPVHFPDAAPDIWINAYDDHHGEENAVTNISAGGLALEVRAGLVPRGLAPGSAVVLKCSLFQFKEKQFRPYWYAGVVRGLDAADGPQGADGKLRRIAVGFTHVGAPDQGRAQGIAWTARSLNETQGERR